jgi:hypothetical protein
MRAGSGSTGSICFWASRIRIHSSVVWIRIRLWPRIRILLSASKNSKKNLDTYCFVTSFGLFIFENDVNVPSKSNKQKNILQNLFFVGILKVSDENSRIRIHTKMSWIRNTGKNCWALVLLNWSVLWIRIRWNRNYLVSWIIIRIRTSELRFRFQILIIFRRYKEISENVQYLTLIIWFTTYIGQVFLQMAQKCPGRIRICD